MTNNTADDKMLTVQDIQKYFSCSKNKAYDIVSIKSFPKIKIGRTIYIPQNEFNKWVKNNLNKQL